MFNHTKLINSIRDSLNISNEVVVHLDYYDLSELETMGFVSRNKELTTFNINIDCNLSLEEEIAVIKHEFKHIQQRLEKRLESDEEGYIWCGIRMGFSNDYYDFPWEVEAREFEDS